MQIAKRKFSFQTVDDLRGCLEAIGRDDAVDTRWMYVYGPNGAEFRKLSIRTETLSDGSKVHNILKTNSLLSR